jgi:hypothetical protein
MSEGSFRFGHFARTGANRPLGAAEHAGLWCVTRAESLAQVIS